MALGYNPFNIQNYQTGLKQGVGQIGFGAPPAQQPTPTISRPPVSPMPQPSPAITPQSTPRPSPAPVYQAPAPQVSATPPQSSAPYSQKVTGISGGTHSNAIVNVQGGNPINLGHNAVGAGQLPSAFNGLYSSIFGYNPGNSGGVYYIPSENRFVVGDPSANKQQPTTPQPTAPTSATPNPTAPAATFSEPRTLGNQVLRYLGYTGEFGGGGGQSWLSSNPDKMSQFQVLKNALDVDGSNRPIPISDIAKYGQLFGYQGTTEYVSPEQEFLNKVDEILRNAYPQEVYGASADQSQATPAAPTYLRPDEPLLPSSLQALKDLTELQRRTNIASESIYGQGVDDQAINYYLDLLQRNAIGESGDIGNLDLLPIETQFLERLGLDYDSGTDFLDSVMNYYKLLG